MEEGCTKLSASSLMTRLNPEVLVVVKPTHERAPGNGVIWVSAMRREWSIVTPEYPPGSGGIGDYTELVARRLAERGDQVRVFTRSPEGRVPTPGVELELLPDDFGRKSQQMLGAAWKRGSSSTVVLVQYVPQGFRWRGANLPFAAWLAARRERRFVMLHEALFDFLRSDPPKHWALGGVTRAMLGLVAGKAERVFVSTPAWEAFVERWARRRPEWLPIPATLSEDPESLLGHRAPAAPNGSARVCHFGTYGEFITSRLEPLLATLLERRPDVTVELLGRGAGEYARDLVARKPSMRGRVEAFVATPVEIARSLAQASAVVLPFGEGATSRRTTLMNALAVGAAVVTTEGVHSESIWRRSGAVSLYPDHRPELGPAAIERLLDDPELRAEQQQRALALYREQFHLDRVVDRLQACHDAGANRTG